MSARLNFNKTAHFLEKGNILKPITSNVQKNTNSTILSKYNLKLAQPLKIYRKEIVSVSMNSCNRFVSIDEMNQPNGYLISHASVKNGIVETLDINLTSNLTDRPGTCSSLTTHGVCLDPAKNALNRCRSSGNLKKTYNVNRNNDTYYTSSKQYLESRNRLFAQNQFNYMKQGDLNALPGSAASDNNLYAVQGQNHCSDTNGSSYVPVYYKPNNYNYAQQGAVSSSSRITRLKYNTITTNALAYRNALGNAVGNALAYSTNSRVYTLKDKIGFPNKCTPVFTKYSDTMKKCVVSTIANQI